MKKIATLLILLLFTITVFGQTEGEIIKKANDLIENKKYESAFKLLDNFDPDNKKPDILLLKEDILLDYFVSSIMHEIFALEDIGKDENILDHRGKEGSFGMYPFSIDTSLRNLIKVYPNNCNLYNGLGKFYYEVSLKYPDGWLKETDLIPLMETNYLKAVENECGDYLSYYVLGYVNISNKKYKEGIPYFLKSIELNKNYESSYYNLALAYLFIDERENALKYAKISLNLYKDKSYKSDAARMIGQIYAELKDDINALANYELADKIDSGNYYNIKPLLNMYVKTGSEKANETTKIFFNLEPTNPTIYNDLEKIYYSNKKENDLIAFYKGQLPVFKDDTKISGNLNFYLGKSYLDTDKKSAKEYFLRAKDLFSKVYDKNHPVFKALEGGIKETEN